MDYVSIDFGVDSSSRFRFRTRTNRQRDRQTDAIERLSLRGNYDI